jgi:hypothetical protein
LEEILDYALQKVFEWWNLVHSSRTYEPEVKSKRDDQKHIPHKLDDFYIKKKKNELLQLQFVAC